MKSKIYFLFYFILFIQGTLMGASIKHITIDDKKIPVVFEKHNSLPIFNLQLVFKNSGYSQDNNNPGITSLLSTILNEGTLKDGSVNFARQLESKAISIHTTNGYETFVIEVSSLKDQYKTALNYLEDLLLDPNFNEDTLEKIKTLHISKLKQKENDFDYIASRNLKSLVFKNTPLEYGNSGTIDSISKTTLEDIKSQYKSLFNLDNLIIVAGGKINFKELKEELYPLFSNFKSNGETILEPVSINTNSKEKIEFKDTQQAYIYFASPFNITFNDKNTYKAKVATFILGGGGFGSRLMEEIRVKRGLAYSAYGNLHNNKSHSYFSGYLQTKIENHKEAKRLVQKIVSDFVKNGVTKKELQAAKKFILGSEPLRTETFSQRQTRAFNLYYKGFDQDQPSKELEKIDSLTLNDLNEFIKKHKEINNLNFSIVTAKEN
jgi:zinc protease